MSAPKSISREKDDFTELDYIKQDLGLKPSAKIWLPGSEMAAKMRKKLDDGRFHRVMSDYFAKIGPNKKKAKQGVVDGRKPWRHAAVLLGTCAVALGCKLTPAHLIKYIKENRHTMGFSQNLKDEMLIICNAYREGQYYEDSIAHSSIEDDEMADDDDESTITVVSAARIGASRPASRPPKPESEGEDDDVDDTTSDDNTNLPTTLAANRSTHNSNTYKVAPATASNIDPTPLRFPVTRCINCKSLGHSDDMPMLVCWACKEAIYCGGVCQRKHWKIHQQSCRNIVRDLVKRRQTATPTRGNGTKRRGPADRPMDNKKRKKTD